MADDLAPEDGFRISDRTILHMAATCSEGIALEAMECASTLESIGAKPAEAGTITAHCLLISAASLASVVARDHLGRAPDRERWLLACGEVFDDVQVALAEAAGIEKAGRPAEPPAVKGTTCIKA